jgi:DNA-binding response OmpR family regulator
MNDMAAKPKRRVLVVEDEALIAMFIKDCLVDAGYDVVAMAATLPQALALAQTLELEAAVLDVNLKGGLSFPVAELLAQRNIPFVICTGYDTGNFPAVAQGAPSLAKPVLPEQLIAAVADIMRASRQRCPDKLDRATEAPGGTDQKSVGPGQGKGSARCR